MTGQRTPPGGWTDDPTRTTQPPSFGRFDGLGVHILKKRLEEAYTLLQRAKRLHYNPRIVDQAIRVLEGNDGPLDLG